MAYITELHVHARETSPCADMPTECTVERYIEAGYSTLVVTDHYCDYVIDSFEGSWQDKITRYLKGYRAMQHYAQGRLHVLLGCELRFTENLNDYLVYGMDEEFLLTHPNLHHMTLQSFSELARENGLLLIQAHPFRKRMTVIDPKYLDGVEVFNGHKGHDSRNPLADALAQRYGLLRTSGSDFHHKTSECSGGIITDQPVTSLPQLVDILRRGDCILRRAGTVGEREGMNDTPARYEGRAEAYQISQKGF